MLTALQDLKQQKFTIDAEPTDTVRAWLTRNHKPSSLLTIPAQIAQVKEKVAAEKGWEASTQKLIYSGMLAPSPYSLTCQNLTLS